MRSTVKLITIVCALICTNVSLSNAEKPSPAVVSKVRKQVSRASKAWINNFNAGKVDAIANAYTQDATMWAEPVTIVTGRRDIRGFWDALINNPDNPASNLKYRKTRIRVLSPTLAILSADWSMNIGGGIIYQEKWVKQKNGKWLLQSDHFDILRTNSP